MTLKLKKETIVKLQKNEMQDIKGGKILDAAPPTVCCSHGTNCSLRCIPDM
jgi:natural product precursor